MTKKTKRRLLQLFGFIIGLIFGSINPTQIQQMFPALGITVGIGYFITSRVADDKDKSLDDLAWFPLLQMIMYFIIGGAISSSLLLAMEIYSN